MAQEKSLHSFGNRHLITRCLNHFMPFRLMGVVMTQCCFRFVQAYLMNSVGMRGIEALRNDLYKKNVLLPMRFFEESHVGMRIPEIFVIKLLVICPLYARLSQMQFADSSAEALFI